MLATYQDYTLGSLGTRHDICITDAQVLPTGDLIFRPGEGPPQTLGALASDSVEQWAHRKIEHAVRQTLTLFKDTDTIKEYVQKICEPCAPKSPCFISSPRLSKRPFKPFSTALL